MSNRSSNVLIVLAAATLLLAGCTARTGDGNTAAPAVVPGAPTKTYDPGGTYYVREFHLDDGTRCIASYNVGLTCDWGHHER